MAVTLGRDGGRLRVEVTLPAGVTGEFDWRGTRRTLAPGPNAFTVEAAAR